MDRRRKTSKTGKKFLKNLLKGDSKLAATEGVLTENNSETLMSVGYLSPHIYLSFPSITPLRRLDLIKEWRPAAYWSTRASPDPQQMQPHLWRMWHLWFGPRCVIDGAYPKQSSASLLCNWQLQTILVTFECFMAASSSKGSLNPAAPHLCCYRGTRHSRFHTFHAVCTVMLKVFDGKPPLQARRTSPNSGNTQSTNISRFDLLWQFQESKQVNFLLA